MKDIAIHWFRRDLRLEDNSALYAALGEGLPVLPVFFFDREILDKLEPDDRRVPFIHLHLQAIEQRLQAHGSRMWVGYGGVQALWEQSLATWEAAGLRVRTVFVNRDYEPYAQQRDRQMHAFLQARGISMRGFKDHVVLEKEEVVKDDGKPYTVFTPYSRKWRNTLTPADWAPRPSEARAHAWISRDLVPEGGRLPALSAMGFQAADLGDFAEPRLDASVVHSYADTRDIPAVAGTTRLSVHLRFGTVSIREALRVGQAQSEKWVTELIWRDFYQCILYHFPHSVDHAFKPAYDAVQWETNEAHFAAWCAGRTGYPLVDAGMRELLATGWMHNRVRMVVASFLCKHLLLDWRWGERFFAQHLLDFDLASNVGGWQWAAGTGCDAAPYFRVFNPASQQAKFDPNHAYIRRWVPEWGTPAYPAPIVDHAFARDRALTRYKAALQGAV